MRIVVLGRIVAMLTLTCAVFAAGRSMFAQSGLRDTPILRLPPVARIAAEPNLAPARLPALQPPAPPEVELIAPGEPSQPWAATLAEPWWIGELASPQRGDAQPVRVTVEALVLAALQRSAHVRAIRQSPQIWQEEIVRERAAFDLAAFVDSRWRDISEPVGNTLTTGGPPRYNDHDWRTSAGVRKRTTWGGSWELSQRVGLQDTNSVFFVPLDQGVTRFSLSFSQPLMRNRGQAYNQGLIVIAETNNSIVHHATVERLEDHLLETARSYWRLVLHRESLSQRRRHLARAEELAIELERRRELDLLRNQLLRAQAAVATRRAALARADAEVRNAESEIARLTGNAGWSCAAELIPVEPLAVECPLPEPGAALEQALSRRVEIAAAMERVRQAEVRLAMSQNELMPMLNLVFETYLMGLQGDYNIAGSLGDQFTQGAPSYTAGLVFEAPLGNRAAQANLRRRRHEAAQVVHELHAVLADTRAEVEKAVRTAQAAGQEMSAKARAVAATEAELNYLQARWRALQGIDGTVSFLLTDILDAQDRLMQAETELSHARYAWAVSLLELKHATGELMSVEH